MEKAKASCYGPQADTSFYPETLRSIVGDGSIPPPALNASPMVLYHRHQQKKAGIEPEPVERPPHKPVRLEQRPALLFRFTPLTAVQPALRVHDPLHPRDPPHLHLRFPPLPRVLREFSPFRSSLPRPFLSPPSLPHCTSLPPLLALLTLSASSQSSPPSSKTNTA